MVDKCVLVVGATGLVGYAAMKHFARLPGVRVIALSRRQPDETFGARWLPLDLTDAAACAAAAGELGQVTHLVYAALYERPGLISGWQEQAQVRVNDAMLRNLLGPLELAAPGLRHVTLLQGTKAYGTHIRPMKVPARENRSELREQVNFYWNQEAYLRGLQAGKAWTFSILRPVLIVGESTGSAMNVIPALGAYAALRRLDGHADLPYPGGAERVAQAVDADLLAEAIAWCGEASAARGEIFNVTNGDVFTWPNVWPAIAAALGMGPGEARPLSLDKAVRPREADWARVRETHALRAPGLADFVGLSFEYADYQMGYGRTEPGPPSIVSTIKLWQAGFHTVMDTEEMFRKAFAGMRARRLLPPV